MHTCTLVKTTHSRPKTLLLIAVTSIFYLALNGCSTPANKTTQPTVERALPPTSVYDLVLAEFALRRGSGDLAAQLYYTQAKDLNDLELSRHAARLAHTLEASKLAFKAANVWLDIAPKNTEARTIQTIARIQQQQNLSPSMPLIREHAELEQTQLFTHLAYATQNTQQQWLLLSALQPLLKQHPTHRNLALACAHLYQHTAQTQQAQHLVAQLLTQATDSHLLRLNIELSAATQQEAAIQRLNHYIKRANTSAQERDQGLNTLVRFAPQQALPIIKQTLAERADAQMLLLLARAHIKLKHYRNAEHVLQQLTSSPAYRIPSQFYLGLIKRAQDQPQQAIHHFVQAQHDDYLVTATEALVGTLMELNKSEQALLHLKQARARSTKPSQRLHLFLLEAVVHKQNANYIAAVTTYDKGLIIFKHHPQLLYNRAVTYINHLPDQAELGVADLHAILKRQINHAPALNALAYYHSQRDIQLAQAKHWIEQALRLDPNQAQYWDTRGLIALKQQAYAEAEQYLTQAYTLQANPDTAAHLMRALWLQNKTQQSLAIWKTASVEHPNHQALRRSFTQLKTYSAQTAPQQHAQARRAATPYLASKRAPKPNTARALTTTKAAPIKAINKTRKPLNQTLTASTARFNDQHMARRITASNKPNTKRDRKFAPPNRPSQQVAPRTAINARKPLQLAQLSKNDYVVQLIALTDQRHFNHYRQSLPRDLNIYHYTRLMDSEIWNVAVLGVYPTRSAARNALNQLPAKLRKHQPWVKSVRNIVKEANGHLEPI